MSNMYSTCTSAQWYGKLPPAELLHGYFNDPLAKAFVRLDAGLYQRIENGNIRL